VAKMVRGCLFLYELYKKLIHTQIATHKYPDEKQEETRYVNERKKVIQNPLLN
jgi:hypothetical protein